MFNANKYKTIINITKVESRNTKNGNEVLTVHAEDGKRYTHFVDEKNEGWEKNLKPGVKLSVYVVKKPNTNPKYKNFPYLNIYPDHFNMKPIDEDSLTYEDVK